MDDGGGGGSTVSLERNGRRAVQGSDSCKAGLGGVLKRLLFHAVA